MVKRVLPGSLVRELILLFPTVTPTVVVETILVVFDMGCPVLSVILYYDILTREIMINSTILRNYRPPSITVSW